MTPHTQTPVRSTDSAELPVQTLSEWHQDQFERHLRYARSLGLAPNHAHRFANQQLQANKARPAARITQ